MAAVTHVKGKELIKAVMIKTDDELIMLALPATRKIDFPTLKKLLGKKEVSLAQEEEFAPLFPDCETGAMPPLGKLYQVSVIADQSLTEDQEIMFNAGTHHEIIKMGLEDFKRLENPRMETFTIHI